MTPVIYLASPIDQGTDDSKERARDVLLSRSCAVFDPSAGWTVPVAGRPSPALQRGNMALLRQCDAMLAILNPKIMTLGVVLELQEMLNMGKPVAIYAPDIRPSWSLAYLGIQPNPDLITAINQLVEGLTSRE